MVNTVTLTVPPSTQEYKWVLVSELSEQLDKMLGGLTRILSREVEVLVILGVSGRELKE